MTETGTSSELEREFYQHLGIAIAEWAWIDAELFSVCAAVFRAPVLQHVAIIYYRTPTVDARLTLTDELVESVLPKPERKSGGHPHPTAKEWTAIEKAIRAELKIRRQLAHSPAYSVAQTEPPLPEGFPLLAAIGEPGKFYRIIDVWFASYVSLTERLRGGAAAESKALKIEDIKSHIERLREVGERLQRFRSTVLSGHPLSPPQPESSRGLGEPG